MNMMYIVLSQCCR